jgi:ankyrin repeat protein
MVMQSAKKSNRSILMSLVVVALMALSASCMKRSNAQRQRADVKPREISVFEPTKQNQAKRCDFLNYTGLPGDEHDSPERHCFLLQERLIKGALDGNLNEIKAALRDGAHVEGTSYNRFPALHSAAMQGHADAVALLLDNGASVNRVADFENTSLNAAASYGHIDLVRVLLERGADACYKSSAGTAGDIALARGHKDIAELLKVAEVAKCK